MSRQSSRRSQNDLKNITFAPGLLILTNESRPCLDSPVTIPDKDAVSDVFYC
jgi:hypothetical protein